MISRFAGPATVASAAPPKIAFLTRYANLRQSTAVTHDGAASMVQRSLAALDHVTQAAGFIRRELLALPAPARAAAPASISPNPRRSRRR